VIDLEAALTDLADHLDHPAGDDLAGAVLRRISSPEPHRSPSRSRTLLVLAAAIVVIVATLFAIAPARRAIADWLGIGAVEVVRTEHPLPPGSSALTVPGAPDAPPSGAVAQRLAAARKLVSFTIAEPHGAAVGALLGVDSDSRVPGGLVALRYKGFTLVEIATARNGPTVAKFIDPEARLESVTVAGRPGMWITGAHQIGYLNRAGNVETETVRRSGPVLLWARAGVTYRIEGIPRLAAAQAIAATIR
jgi:hypothetical protein